MWTNPRPDDIPWWTVQKANQAGIYSAIVNALHRRNADRLDLQGVTYLPGEALLTNVDWTRDHRGVHTVSFRLETLSCPLYPWEMSLPLEPMAVLLTEC